MKRFSRPRGIFSLETALKGGFYFVDDGLSVEKPDRPSMPHMDYRCVATTVFLAKASKRIFDASGLRWLKTASTIDRWGWFTSFLDVIPDISVSRLLD